MTTVPDAPATDPESATGTVVLDRASLAAMGSPITGPTALGSDAQRFWRLAWTLAITDFKLRFFGSVLGYLWQLVRPLMLFGVIYFVFSTVLSFSKGVHYPVALLLGIVLYGFFAEVTGGAVRSLVNRESLVRKIEFPRLAVPMAVLITALMNLGLNLIPVLVFLLVSGGEPRLSWVELPFIIAALCVFAFGLAMLLSSLFIRFRDIEPIWEVILQAMFYASPIFWTIESLQAKFLHHQLLRTALMSNPFAVALNQARHAFIDPSYANAHVAIGRGVYLVIPIALVAGLLGVGFAVFSRTAPTIAEEL